MRSSLRTLAIAGASLCLVLGAATPALAAPGGTHATSAELVGVVKQTGATTAEVQARYSCTGDPTRLGLWVSVKQTAARTADPILATPESSAHSAAWSQSHRVVEKLICDGRTHVGKFVVDQVEYGFGTLAKGEAYVQFCLFDLNYRDAPLSENEFLHVR